MTTPMVRLEDRVEGITVGWVGPMAGEYLPRGVPFLRSTNIRPHKLDLSDVRYISPKFHAKISKSRLSGGDVAVVRTGKPGTAVCIPSNAPEMNCADLVIIHPGPQINGSWLSYYINAAADGFIASRLVGAVQQHFNVGSAREILIPDIPRSQQDAVAAVLGALDDKITANTALAGTAEDLAKAHFSSWASTAKRRSLTAISTPLLGGTPDRGDREYWGPETPWASARDVAAASNGVLMGTAEMITTAATSSATRLQAHPIGTVFLTARGTVGAVVRTAVASSINQSCYAFRSPEGRSALLYLTVLHGVERMRAMAHGSVFSTITMPTIAAIQVPDIQAFSQEAADLLEALLNAVAQAIRENEALAVLRDALLPALMSGRLRVGDAERQVGDAI